MATEETFKVLKVVEGNAGVVKVHVVMWWQQTKVVKVVAIKNAK